MCRSIKLLVSCVVWIGTSSGAFAEEQAELSRAVILRTSSTTIHVKAAEMLRDEIQKRTRISLEIVTEPPDEDSAAIVVGKADKLPEPPGGLLVPRKADGYALWVDDRTGGSVRVYLAGYDDRGTLFAVGRLLRLLHMERDSLWVDSAVKLATAPRYPLRGHQLGYRPLVNSYDGWTVKMFEHYYRDMIVFGANAVELIPPTETAGGRDSPHFPLPMPEMMVQMSQLADDYGLDVWIWFPAMEEDYSDPNTVESAVREWAEVFRSLPRIDHVFVPGGDPGNPRPTELMALLEKQTESLQQYHPNAKMWVSPQSFSAEWLEEFYDLVSEEPNWLTGIVHGPQVRDSIPELRRRLPGRYPIRRYPDITHSRHCQYFVPDWDLAYMVTEAREVYNPRPLDETDIFHAFEGHAIGFLTYSEGINDDVNKIIWSALGWDPDSKPIDILREFSRYFIGNEYADTFAHGLMALERNWRGPLISNSGVETTFLMFRNMEENASPQVKLNWRFQQGLYRAYYDTYVRRRLIQEQDLEKRAVDQLRQAEKMGSLIALSEAGAVLDLAVTKPVAQDIRARLYELAEALYQSSRSQLSVEKYQAIRVDRGANLDTVDRPLNNRLWLKQRFEEIRGMDTEGERLAGIEEVLNWTNPGPGGFYDDLGNSAWQSHLVRGPGYPTDPAHLESSYTSLGREAYRLPSGETRFYPLSWWSTAGTLYDQPLRLRYDGLDPEAQYKIRVVYSGGSPDVKVRLRADGQYEVHPLISKPVPYRPVEFDIPAAATSDGELELTFSRELGSGGNGRGMDIGEIWLIRKD